MCFFFFFLNLYIRFMLVGAGAGKLNFGPELEFGKLEFQNQSNLLISLTRILFTKFFF